MTILGNILVIYVMMHFSPSLYKTVDCSLVTRPTTVTALSGQVVTLDCSAETKDSIIWEIINPVPQKPERIYDKTNLTKSGVSYNISVSDGDEKTRSLTFTASLKTAKKYKCLDINYGDVGSGTADVFFLESQTKCRKNWEPDESVNISCSVVHSGNWDPVLKCTQANASKILIDLQRNELSKNPTIDNGKTSTWSFYSKNKANDIICSTELFHADRRRQIVAVYTGLDWRDRAIHFLITIFVGKNIEPSELYGFLQSKQFENEARNIKNSTDLSDAVSKWKTKNTQHRVRRHAGQNRDQQSSESDWRDRALNCSTYIIQVETGKNATEIYIFLKYEKFDRKGLNITNFYDLVKAVEENNRDLLSDKSGKPPQESAGNVGHWIAISGLSITLIGVIGANGTVTYHLNKHGRFEIGENVISIQKSSEVEDKNKVELQKAKPETERREGMDPASNTAIVAGE